MRSENGGVVNWNETILQAQKLLEKVGLNVNPEMLIKELGVGKQQLVEIAKALSKNVKLLILDEPTAALNENDSENLLQLLRELKKQGITCIMISHKLKEVIAIADKATVLRDGETICTLDAAKGEISENVIIKHMVGREIEDIFRSVSTKRMVTASLSFATGRHSTARMIGRILRNMSIYHVKKGEIVGIAGLMGSGRTELAQSIFGNPKGYRLQGELLFENTPRTFRHPKDAINAGIAYVTEDRKGDGLFLIPGHQKQYYGRQSA